MFKRNENCDQNLKREVNITCGKMSGKATQHLWFVISKRKKIKKNIKFLTLFSNSNVTRLWRKFLNQKKKKRNKEFPCTNTTLTKEESFLLEKGTTEST